MLCLSAGLFHYWSCQARSSGAIVQVCQSFRDQKLLFPTVPVTRVTCNMCTCPMLKVVVGRAGLEVCLEGDNYYFCISLLFFLKGHHELEYKWVLPLLVISFITLGLCYKCAVLEGRVTCCAFFLFGLFVNLANKSSWVKSKTVSFAKLCVSIFPALIIF